MSGSDERKSPVDRRPPVEIVLCPGGPALIRGAGSAVDVVVPDDADPGARRPVMALCRCGRTGRDPWCDGTHKLARRRPRARRADDAEEDR